MSAPKLWSWHLSPFAAKVRIAFAEKRVPVELVEIDPRQRPARLRELNPTARVPVLEAGGMAIFESTAICEWLEEAHPEPPLWPSGGLERGAARGRLRWVDDELTRNFFLSMRKQAFGIDSTDHPDVIDTMRARLVSNWPKAERLLADSGGEWMMPGDQPTLVDLAAIPLAVRLPEWKPELQPDPQAHPHVTAWLGRLRERPSAAEVGTRGTLA